MEQANTKINILKNLPAPALRAKALVRPCGPANPPFGTLHTYGYGEHHRSDSSAH